ncbi:MAG: carbohydrate ABC transporter permease [Treponema sp.]|jgi:raffinose/stachyose/melibiose transport system permease protein|nr:carbohydrate ABC transporter permease [Treponema sp.]
MNRKRSIVNAVLYFFAGLWTFMTIMPLFVTMLSSVKDNDQISLGMFRWPVTFFWSNYLDAFTIAHMGRAVLNSIFIASASTILVIIIGMLAAYILARKRFRILPVIYSFFIVGVMVPVHTTIIPISSLATFFRAKDTYWYIIVVYMAFNLFQTIFLSTGYLRGIGRELDDAATIDGCNDFTLLFRILLPICTPIVMTEAILSFVYGYGELIFSMILISDETKYTISRAMLTFRSVYQVKLGPIFASIIVAVVPMITLYMFFHEKVQAGMLQGAVKG